jgi:lipopolysaccharide transport system permease protein
MSPVRSGEETVYSSASQLVSPRRFAADALRDLKVVPAGGWRLFLRRTQSRFRRSRLGYAWLVLPMVATVATWSYLDHVRLVRLGDTSVPYVAFAASGFVFWQAFADAAEAPLRYLTESRAVLTKTRQPHETWLAAALLEVALNFVVRLAVVLVVLAIAGVGFRASMLLAPVGAAALIVLGFALGLGLAPVGLLYEDVAHGLRLVTGLWFFLTPVIYPIPSDGTIAAVVEGNPVTPLLVTARGWLAGTADHGDGGAAIVAACAFVMLVATWLGYRLARPHLVARL